MRVRVEVINDEVGTWVFEMPGAPRVGDGIEVKADGETYTVTSVCWTPVDDVGDVIVRCR